VAHHGGMAAQQTARASRVRSYWHMARGAALQVARRASPRGATIFRACSRIPPLAPLRWQSYALSHLRL